MDEGDKQILKFLVQKELDTVEKEEEDVIFPELNFLKGREEYEVKLRELLKKL